MYTKIFIAFAALLCIQPNVQAHDTVNGVVVNSVYDGDTMRITVAGWPDIMGHNMPIRINGIDTPEIRGKCQSEKDKAILARDMVLRMVAAGREVSISNLSRGKYFRIVADVYVDGISIGQTLLEMGLAVSYNGKGKRHNWCE